MRRYTFKNREEYEKVHILPFNRKYTVRQDLIESMNKYGFIVPIILIRTDIFTGRMEIYVADGQNRGETALHLNIPIEAVLYEGTFSSEEEIVHFVAQLNAAHKIWRIENYVNAFAHLNYEHYQKLNQITVQSPYRVNAIATMLAGFRSTSHVSGLIKSGKYQVKELDETLYTLKLVAKLSKIGKVSSTMAISLHYTTKLKKFDEQSFIEKFTMNYHTIRDLQLDDYTDIFTSWLGIQK